MTAIRVIITGRVQGVGYRAWTVAKAKSLNLKGWVRNKTDGAVEAVFSGEQANIDTMIDSCKKGPATAHVERIEFFTTPACDEIFTAKPTL